MSQHTAYVMVSDDTFWHEDDEFVMWGWYSLSLATLYDSEHRANVKLAKLREGYPDLNIRIVRIDVQV